jgi:tetratricopeptide (TPR) repeat protein
VARFIVFAAVIAALAAPAGAVAGSARSLDDFEQAITADPENLPLAAEYRQRAIGDRAFDRSIDFLERLAKRKGSGPNIQISVALAYVDKVPTSGDIRRLYLGRDAMSALTKSLAQRPTALAYYVRGVINLFYNAFIFHRADKGVADLTQALSLVTTDTPPLLVRRIYAALGDGYFRLQDVAKAKSVWNDGLSRCPGDAALRQRIAAEGAALKDIVTKALYAGYRVDTTLHDMLPLP